MFLYVYIFLMLTALGLFTEVYMLQASKLWAAQKAVAELMQIWHGGGYTMAKELRASLGATYPCRLTPTALPGIGASVPQCQKILQDPSAPLGSYPRYYLPPGYRFDQASFQFPSVVYKAGTSIYLLTYIPPTADGSPSWLGYTADEILQQMQKTDAPAISYGKVMTECNGATGHFFVTVTYQNTTNICFPVPTAVVPDGSVGYISVL